jgi:hypothetical protein
MRAAAGQYQGASSGFGAQSKHAAAAAAAAEGVDRGGGGETARAAGEGAVAGGAARRKKGAATAHLGSGGGRARQLQQVVDEVGDGRGGRLLECQLVQPPQHLRRGCVRRQPLGRRLRWQAPQLNPAPLLRLWWGCPQRRALPLAGPPPYSGAPLARQLRLLRQLAAAPCCRRRARQPLPQRGLAHLLARGEVGLVAEQADGLEGLRAAQLLVLGCQLGGHVIVERQAAGKQLGAIALCGGGLAGAALPPELAFRCRPGGVRQQQGAAAAGCGSSWVRQQLGAAAALALGLAWVWAAAAGPEQACGGWHGTW